MRCASTFTYKDLIINKAKNLKKHPDTKGLGFGKHPTDHILEVNYSKENGFDNPTIKPYGDFSLDPCSSVFHYGLCVLLFCIFIVF